MKVIDLEDAIGCVQFEMHDLGRPDKLNDGELLRDFCNKMMQHLVKELKSVAMSVDDARRKEIAERIPSDDDLDLIATDEEPMT